MRDHHDVAGLEAREQTVQLGLLVALLRAGLLLHDLLASRFDQDAALRFGMCLVAGRVPKVADQHGDVPSNEARSTREPPRSSAEREGVPCPSNPTLAGASQAAIRPDGTLAVLHISKLRNMDKV